MSSEPPAYSPLVHRAFDFAARAHEGQRRKNSDIPYFSHCASVARLLEQAGFDEDVVAAGALHDTVEDTGVSLEAIGQAFNERVQRLVDFVTEADKKQSWEVRKEHYIHRLETGAPVEAFAISCADKTHNLWSLLLDRKEGCDVWRILKRDKETQIERFDTMARLYREHLDHPLRDLFEEALKKVKEEC